jgi:hypothetical protein
MVTCFICDTQNTNRLILDYSGEASFTLYFFCETCGADRAISGFPEEEPDDAILLSALLNNEDVIIQGADLADWNIFITADGQIDGSARRTNQEEASNGA